MDVVYDNILNHLYDPYRVSQLKDILKNLMLSLLNRIM